MSEDPRSNLVEEEEEVVKQSFHGVVLVSIDKNSSFVSFRRRDRVSIRISICI